MNETLRAKLRQRLDQPGLVVAPGVFDMVSLRLADTFGFDATLKRTTKHFAVNMKTMEFH